MRKRIFEIIEKAEDGDTASLVYDIFMIFVIFISILPLCFINQTKVFIIIDKVSASIFIADYFVRFATADFKKGKSGITSFVLYPLHPLAIIDLISILPSFTNLNNVFHILRLPRLLKALRIFRVFRYSKNIQIITSVLRREKDALMAVGILSVAYIIITALIVFQIEPYTFGNFFKAVYWATVSLTTVGYGDIYPVSVIGQVISMVSSFLGIAIIALPSGIIITGYQEELRSLHDKKNNKE